MTTEQMDWVDDHYPDRFRKKPGKVSQPEARKAAQEFIDDLYSKTKGEPKAPLVTPLDLDPIRALCPLCGRDLSGLPIETLTHLESEHDVHELAALAMTHFAEVERLREREAGVVKECRYLSTEVERLREELAFARTQLEGDYPDYDPATGEVS